MPAHKTKKKRRISKKPPPPVPVELAATLDEARDAALLRSAREKLQASKSPTKIETEAIRRRDKKRSAEFREWCYANVPKREFLAMSGGRQARTINEIACRHGLKCQGSTVDLSEFLSSVWQFLANNRRRLNGKTDQNGPPTALGRRREIMAQKAELELMALSQEVVRTAEVKDGLRIIGDTLRAASETMKRQYGIGPYEVFDEALDEIDREIKERFGETGE